MTEVEPQQTRGKEIAESIAGSKATASFNAKRREILALLDLPEDETTIAGGNGDDYRPVLAAGPYGAAAGYPEQTDALWLARSGRRFPVASIEAMIAKRTTEQFGVRLTPHRFRHCAATAIIENNPKEFHIIRIILGHTTSATGEKYYIEKRNRDAFRMVQDNIVARSKPETRMHRAGINRRVNDDMHDPTAAGMIRIAGCTRAHTRRFIR